MSTAIVPDQQDRTHDMGVATEHGYNRPPFAAVLDAFRQLEISYGTEALAEAFKQFEVDPDYCARKRGLDPERLIRDLRSVYEGLELPEYAAEAVARARTLPVSTPFPGAYSVRPTAATAA